MKQRVITSCILIVLVAMLVGIAYSFSFFDTFQEKINDRFFVKEIPVGNIVLIAIDDRSINELGQWPWPRALFVGAIQKLQNTKVIGFDINFSEPSRIGPFDDESFTQAIDISKVPIVMPVEINKRGFVSVQPTDFIRPHVKLGIVNISSDTDGVLRFMKSGTTTTLFSEILSGKSTEGKKVRINYRGPEKTFLTIPFIDLVEGRIPERITEGAHVLIGATAPNLHDFVQTPFGRLPGVEFHANAIDTLGSGKFFKETSGFVSLVLILLVAGLALLSVLLLKHLTTILVVSAIDLILIFITSLVLFSYKIIIPVLYLELTFILSFVVLIVFQYVFESKEKRFIREAFQYYLTPDVIEELIKNPDKIALGGEKRNMTILFSDIRGFTTISEKLSAEELTSLLNEYLTAMTDIVMDEGGVVDKYIGDAVMAFWGAPLVNNKHAIDACVSSVKMVKTLSKLNEDWAKRALPRIDIGIGLNTGDVVVGNMGSRSRFNYTVMGDEVNLASRLEGLTKYYGVACLVSEEVYTQAQSDTNLLFRKLDVVLVKGKKEPKTIYELVADASILDIREDFEKARMLYVEGKWGEALRVFEKILDKKAQDGPTKMYIERCKVFLKDPPTDWKGVYEFKDK